MPEDTPSLESIIADALNEHGFLFQQRFLDEVNLSSGCNWQPASVEFPVSFGAPGTFETRIDAVLTNPNKKSEGWHLLVECKRANPEYKRWVFFDDENRIYRDTLLPGLWIQVGEFAGSWNHTDPFPLTKRIEYRPAPKGCPIYNFYLETRLNAKGKTQRASATTAIEDAFRQLSIGVVGLGRILSEQRKYKFRLVPVVVTTAELFSADFSSSDVSLSHGQIAPSHLKVTPRDWVSVNYRIDESVSRFADLTGGIGEELSHALTYRYLRTMFVVRADKIKNFLTWLDNSITG